MPEIICNTSPLQYLHQLGLLHILPALARPVTVPPAVIEEIDIGRKLGLNLPDLAAIEWITTRRPVSFAALPLVSDLGSGETEVLALALETKDAIPVLDDAVGPPGGRNSPVAGHRNARAAAGCQAPESYPGRPPAS